MQSIEGICVDVLARVKSLDPAWLRTEFGVTDVRYYGQPAVRIPYYGADGSWLYDKLRLADGQMRYAQADSSPALYGLQRLAFTSAGQMLWVCEGETDIWAAWSRGVPAAGVPGATMWQRAFGAAADVLRRFHDIVLWEEPGSTAQRLAIAVARDLPNARVVAGDSEAKDLCELHQRLGPGFRPALEARIDRAGRLYDRALELALREPPRVTFHRPRYSVPPSGRATDHGKLERARARLTIDILTERGAHLRGRGAWRTTRCPFRDHEDATPSFAVHVTAGWWRCFGCGRHGTDAISLVRQLDGLSFRGAVAAIVL